MYQLRYYNTLKDLNSNSLNYELVGIYHTPSLAYGMRKKTALKPQYSLELLKVVQI